MTEKTTERDLGQVEGKTEVILPLLLRLEERVHSIEKRVWMAAGGSVLIAELLAKFDWSTLFGHAAKAAGLQ